MSTDLDPRCHVHTGVEHVGDAIVGALEKHLRMQRVAHAPLVRTCHVFERRGRRAVAAQTHNMLDEQTADESLIIIHFLALTTRQRTHAYLVHFHRNILTHNAVELGRVRGFQRHMKS